MPDARHHRPPAGGEDRLLHHSGRPQIVEAHRTRIGLEHIAGNQRGHEVHRNYVALLVEETRAVGIAVVSHAESVLAGIGAHERLKVPERLVMKRIGVVIRKIAVVFPVERIAGDHRILERAGFGDAHAVGEIDRKMKRTGHMRERLDMGGVVGGNIDLDHRPDSGRGLVKAHFGDDALNLLDSRRARNRHRARLAELAAVPLLRIVRRGYHHRAVGLELGVGEITHRRGCKTDINNLDALIYQPRRKRGEKRIRRFAAVARHHHPAPAGKAAETGVRAGDFVKYVLVEILPVNPANVVCLENSHISPFDFN